MKPNKLLDASKFFFEKCNRNFGDDVYVDQGSDLYKNRLKLAVKDLFEVIDGITFSKKSCVGWEHNKIWMICCCFHDNGSQIIINSNNKQWANFDEQRQVNLQFQPTLCSHEKLKLPLYLVYGRNNTRKKKYILLKGEEESSNQL